MTTATQMYALSSQEMAQGIAAGGHLRSVLVEGPIGIGKTYLQRVLAKMLPTHTPVYFDCSTKDLGDITIPDIMHMDDGTGFVRYVTNEELGAHHDKPIILMIDELGKCNPAVLLSLLRVILERKIGSYTLHPESIVFCTTNLGAEGVGDILPAHARNRITVAEMAKPTWDQWIEWGLANGIDHTLLGWCRNNEKAFADFRDFSDPEANDYIHHPRSTRTAFVTPRSLEAASDWMKLYAGGKFSDKVLTSYLMGTIGTAATGDLMAFTRLADQMPTIDSIKDDPQNALIPTSVGGVMMVVYKVLASLEREWVDAWMVYMDRLSTEAQGVFINATRVPDYPKQKLLSRNRKFTDWCVANQYLFTADVQ